MFPVTNYPGKRQPFRAPVEAANPLRCTQQKKVVRCLVLSRPKPLAFVRGDPGPGDTSGRAAQLCALTAPTTLVRSDSVCGYSGAGSSDLKEHGRIHPASKPFVCPYDNCGYAFRQSAGLTQHLRIHAGKQPFVCPWEDCGCAYGQSAKLTKHLLGHSGRKALVCPQDGCRYSCAEPHHLKKHLRIHAGENLCACPYESCGYVFRDSVGLTQHLRLHAGKRPFVCPWKSCKCAFVRAADLTQHLRVHAGKKSLACSHESHEPASRRSDSLKRDPQRNRSGAKPCVCPYEGCGRRFAVSGSLRKHLRRHCAEKPFVCLYESCGRAFAVSDSLRRHLRCHSGEKPFVCPYYGCGHACARSGDLTRHKRCHTGERPFVCAYEGCGRLFFRKYTLTIHRRVHAGGRPFVSLRKGRKKLSVRSGPGSPGRGSAGRSRHLEVTQRLTRAPRPSGLRLPLENHPSHLPFLAAGAGVPVVTGPVADLDRQSPGFDRDRPCATTTAPAAEHQWRDRSPALPEEEEQRAQWDALPPCALLQDADFAGLVSMPAQDVDMSDWLPGFPGESSSSPLCSLPDTGAFDLDAASALRADDEKAFWQTLLSPADTETLHLPP